MQTPKEVFLELLKPNGKPDRQLCQYEALHLCLSDPINAYLRGNRKRGTVSRDRWGTVISFPENAPGAIPMNHGDLAVCPDVTHWRDTVHAPDLEAKCTEGWEECRRKAREASGDRQLLAGFMGTGIFEQCHFLMGFENTLTALYEHPDAMHELIAYITEYRLSYVRLLIDRLQPDAIFSHDDWGTRDALFMHPDVWRAFFKEPYRRFYGYIASRGCIPIHHADSYLVPIVEDMAEIGIRVWQGVLPENDIPALQDRLRGRLVLMGGLGAQIDREDTTREEALTYAKHILCTCCPGGHFIPSITYGVPGTVFPQVDEYLNEEIAAYNREWHFPRFPLPHVPHRTRQETEKEPVPTASLSSFPEEEGPYPKRVAAALYHGRQKNLLALCEEAVSAGVPADEILNDGLIAGMNQLGEDFSANRVFVPEMLLAARCMAAATAWLKPYLTAGSGENAPVGRAVIGTVRGDLHDIGKNLVKIMMEGSGIEVIDLGSDVPAERFLQAAAEYHCGAVCCSALLTTTMNEMRRVVALAKETGIRDQIKIFVGGAPISQDFCDEIGADVYTEDAGAAARAAVAVLKAQDCPKREKIG